MFLNTAWLTVWYVQCPTLSACITSISNFIPPSIHPPQYFVFSIASSLLASTVLLTPLPSCSVFIPLSLSVCACVAQLVFGVVTCLSSRGVTWLYTARWGSAVYLGLKRKPRSKLWSALLYICYYCVTVPATKEKSRMYWVCTYIRHTVSVCILDWQGDIREESNCIIQPHCTPPSNCELLCIYYVFHIYV